MPKRQRIFTYKYTDHNDPTCSYTNDRWWMNAGMAASAMLALSEELIRDAKKNNITLVAESRITPCKGVDLRETGLEFDPTFSVTNYPARESIELVDAELEIS